MIFLRVLRTASVEAAAVLGRDACLSGPERTRSREFLVRESAEAFVLGRVLLRETLSEVCGGEPARWCIEAGKDGRPLIMLEAPAGIDFNVTHTRGLVAVAVGTCSALGIDAESLERDSDVTRIARRFFAEEEVAELAALAGEAARRRRALHLWTLKESWLKATGVGLRGTLRAAQFRILREPSGEFGRDGVAHRLPAGTGDDWQFGLMEIDGLWSFSIAARGARAPLAVNLLD